MLPYFSGVQLEFEKGATGTPFQSFAWLSNWQNTVGYPLHNIHPQIAVVRNENETVAIFPMSIRVSMGVSILKWLGGLHTDYMEPLLSEKWKDIEKYFPLCWKNIIDKLYPFDVIHFQKQKENIGTSHNPFIYSMSCYKKLIAYQDNLNHSWQEQYEKKVKNKFRADSRRQRRRLAEFGELRFVVAKDRGGRKKILLVA